MYKCKVIQCYYVIEAREIYIKFTNLTWLSIFMKICCSTDLFPVFSCFLQTVSFKQRQLTADLFAFIKAGKHTDDQED